MMVLMHNIREVPAEWQVKAPTDAGSASDWSHFTCEPEQGLVPPGQKQLLKVQTLSLSTPFCMLPWYLLPYTSCKQHHPFSHFEILRPGRNEFFV